MPDVFVSPQKTDPVIPNRTPVTEADRAALPDHTHRRLSAFNFYPDHVDFESRENEEEIILLLRQHPIVNLKWIFVTVLLVFVPTIVRYLGILTTLPSGFEFVLNLSWYLVTMAYALEGFLSWYFNVYFVTNQRVIDVDFFNLIDKRVSDADLGKIQDVSYTTMGVLGTILNFGDVIIQTAAEVSEFDFESVPNPERVTKIIDDLRGKEKGDGI